MSTKRLTIEDCHGLAKEKGGKCLSTTYRNNYTKLEWQCECGNTWNAILNSIRQGSWCRICSHKKVGFNNRLSLQDCQSHAKSQNGKCLSVEYTHSEAKMEWLCDQNHTWQATFANVKRGTWCPICAKGINKVENKVRIIFETYFNKQFPTVKPDFLKNPATGWRLELDGYCEELKLAFEYDGEQHYKEIEHWNDIRSLDSRQQYDELKTDLCKNAGITLIRIPYWEKDNLEEYIRILLNHYSI
jgi:hypothetical protein